MRRFALLIALVAIATAEPRLTRVSAQTRTLTVAAASDLQAALPEMIKGFEREAKATVTVSFGSSELSWTAVRVIEPLELPAGMMIEVADGR